MTLKARNRLFSLFFIVSLVCCVFNILLFVNALVQDSIIFPTPAKAIRFTNIFASSELFKYNFYAVFVGIIFFQVYTIISALLVRLHFEKTLALEITYFYGFLLGCLLEGARIFVIAGNLWRTTSLAFTVLQRIVIAGRTCVPLSLLLASIFSDKKYREDVERNVVITILIVILTGIMFPLETTKITSTFTTYLGFQKFFIVLCVFMVLCTIASILYIGTGSNDSDPKATYNEAVGFTVMIAGYYLLIITDCYFFLALSIALLSFGTLGYLFSIHRIYLWK